MACAPMPSRRGGSSRRWWRTTGRTKTAPRTTTRKRDIIETRAAQSPLRRTGEPEDITWAMLYLASDASRFMTGQVLRPNGGVVMP